MRLPDAAELAALSLREDGIPRDLAKSLLDAPASADLAVLDAAYRVRLDTFGRGVRLHVLLNAKMGACPEDCGFCSQSSRSAGETEVPAKPLLDGDSILHAAKRAHEAGAYKFCIVTATRGPSERDLDQLCPAVERIKQEIPVGICCSLGLLTDEKAQRLAACGVDRFNHNLETSESRYGDVCSTHTWQDRVDTVKRARAAGMEACCGGILGLERTDDDVLDLAYALRDLGVESIPLNFLDPRPGTARADSVPPTPRRCLRMLSLFRLIHPRRDLRAAGGREINLRSLQAMALYAANSIFTEGYLTTRGNRNELDRRTIEDAGFHLEKWEDRVAARSK